MNSAQHDRVFMFTFAVVLGILVAIAVVIGAIAVAVTETDELAPETIARIDARTRPVGAVETDPAALLRAAAAAPKREPLTGEQMVAKVCGACHTTGLMNAPKIGDAAGWAPLAARGLDDLLASAIKGKGAMPPRGGDAAASDEEVRAAIQDMLANSGH